MRGRGKLDGQSRGRRRRGILPPGIRPSPQGSLAGHLTASSCSCVNGQGGGDTCCARAEGSSEKTNAKTPSQSAERR